MKENIDVDKAIRLAVCSDQRKEILLSLKDGMKTLRELRDELKLSAPAIVHALRELETNHLIRQDSKRNYMVTPIGRSAARKVIDFQGAMAALMKHEAFWLGHDLGGIPDNILTRSGRYATLHLSQAPPLIFLKLCVILSSCCQIVKL